MRAYAERERKSDIMTREFDRTPSQVYKKEEEHRSRIDINERIKLITQEKIQQNVKSVDPYNITIIKDDTLYGITQAVNKLEGASFTVEQIWAMNVDIISKPGEIFPGQILRIPTTDIVSRLRNVISSADSLEFIKILRNTCDSPLKDSIQTMTSIFSNFSSATKPATVSIYKNETQQQRELRLIKNIAHDYKAAIKEVNNLFGDISNFYKLIKELRSIGQSLFGGASNSYRRHFWASYHSASMLGSKITLTIGGLNEIQGYIFQDLGIMRVIDAVREHGLKEGLPEGIAKMIEAIKNRALHPTAFSLEDFSANSDGVKRYKELQKKFRL